MSSAETDEQREIRSTVRKLLARAQPIEAARQAEGGPGAGFDAAVWRQLSEELGVTAVLVPEEHGGLGLTLSDAAVILEETGRACYNGPFLESAVIAPLLLGLADQDVKAQWSLLVEEQVIATVGGLTAAGSAPSVRAAEGPSGWTLDGTLFGVPQGLVADLVYVVADSAAGTGVWAVRSDAAGHDRAPLATLDLTRPMSTHRFAQTPAELVLAPSTSSAALRLLAALAATALSAEQVGATTQLLEIVIEHLRNRYQFGRALGSFQVLKHRCVNMSISREASAAASWAARNAADQALAGGDDEAPAEAVRLGSIAGAWCSDALVEVAGAALQLHGGTGMTWEHDIHVFLRRAKGSQKLFGAPRDHRRVVRDLLGLSPA
ncbi:acyl-CoA dehydrogenase family protein [Pseudonocardia halophobica]|uniref:Acyl-CoA dehydrogenase n=1 Tax=Pseudonocardia halophobica TaxID=29401 RepID=A0A9W6NVF6_9PSEU|nr:acyl-CoA dehydrogenase family protein [Pseudonocardia halophobica]GLL10558.1 acyl-CoA dehydrogenase [Pseudonocardia halophobica]